MNILFLEQLSEEQTLQVQGLYNLIEFSSIEQFPGYSKAANLKNKIIHAILLSDTIIIGYAQIKIKKYLQASVYFGPLVKEKNDYSFIIKKIKNYCRKNFIPFLKIFPPQYTLNYSSSFWKELKNDIGFETSEKDFNWSTLQLQIDRSDEEILKSFTENHQRSIKKAIKTGLKTEFLNSNEIDTYNEQYCEMYAERGISINKKDNFQKIKGVFDFFENKSKGFFMGIKYDNKLIGGLCISFGNNVAFYVEGYSHPEHRKLPISHLAFYESIKIARDKGIQYFDFGGYALNTNEGDQLHQINKFKEGFRGELIHYPKTMTIYPFLPVKWLYKLSLKFKV